MSGLRNNFDRSRPRRSRARYARPRESRRAAHRAGQRFAGASAGPSRSGAGASCAGRLGDRSGVGRLGDRSSGPAGQYATPFAGPPGQASELSRQLAANRLSGPAIALTVVAWLHLALNGLLIVFAIVVLAAGQNFARNPNAPGDITVQAISWLVSGPIGIAVSIFLLIGAAKMRRLESYSLSMATAIVALIPCTAPCCVVGMGFGIWALVVLCDANVKSAFRS